MVNLDRLKTGIAMAGLEHKDIVLTTDDASALIAVAEAADAYMSSSGGADGLEKGDALLTALAALDLGEGG